MIKFIAGYQYVPNQVIGYKGKLLKILQVKVIRKIFGFKFQYNAQILGQ